jgi:RNA 2',3'-cyclic 3'-phosphodiesterase
MASPGSNRIVRLFVALTPPQDVIAELDAVVAPLRQAWPELRWQPPHRWHVTLAFLGEVQDAKLDQLMTRLERAASRHPRQYLAIKGAGAFPSAAKARVAITRIEATDTGALAALAASVAAGARRAGAPPPDEGRKYRPHLTLARTREPADLAALVESLADYAGNTWQSTQIELIRSFAGPAPRYEMLAAWPLKAPGDGPNS